ncbi:PAS domain-containing protein [uncultured Kiloniella sp.]|uniref:PAS domain-containing protein n=1 Tax=uncultured Kiloniella sp. TaxID=1133091 RepID=UPI00262E3D5F|nr:PAS domain-containing protein [uncultured Kiloniella sp.]
MIELYHPKSQALLDHWLSLPREGVLPLRSSFLPEKVPQILPSLIIYEMVAEDFIRFRLAGTAVRERMGFDPTGENYLNYVADERKEKASQSFFAVIDQPCGMRVISNHGMSTGRKMFLEVLMLPLKNDMSPNPIVLCQSNEIKPIEEEQIPDNARVENITIVRRDFIDIGAGISDFKD